ncbi:cysteine--tRNA ligase [candidate division KSB1 bacterium RBG_16_48_16]|nr:MAG: cysteine--tRNA ligase [candidate division KSB1 bacterium RBG_16_48_16]
MPLTIYNSLSRKKEIFKPLNEGRVLMYVCGPTVYDYPHIGHAKSYISFDVIVRYFRYLNYTVRYVQNITDVGHLLDSGEDRILKGAKREKLEPMELVERYTWAYFDAMDALNVVRPDISPRATGHVPEQVAFVRELIRKGYAYEMNGSVYFDVTRWESYGKLSGRKVEDQQAGARVDVNEEKRNPADFALWKKAEPEHVMQWDSPWGRGYPGWHIECSAMSMKYLGTTFDIHGGGIENQFPHHECEIAQSEALTGKPFANYWMHNNMVLVNGVKMSKSLGNFTTISDALQKYSGEQIRFFILQTHYRSPVDFSDDAMDAASQGLDRLLSNYWNLKSLLQQAPEGEANPRTEELTSLFREKFEEQMNDDFNTPAAIAQVFEYFRRVNKFITSENAVSRSSIQSLIQPLDDYLDRVLGIVPYKKPQDISAGPFIDLLISVRNELRRKKEWQLSDFIRDKLIEQNIELEDGKEETKWRVRQK